MSAADPYSDRVRRLFAEAAHAGTAPGAAEAAIEAQGVRITLSARVESGRIAECRFLAWGCPHLIAACEYWCAAHEGRDVQALAGFPGPEIMEALGIPVDKTGRILVLEDAARLLGERLGVTLT